MPITLVSSAFPLHYSVWTFQPYNIALFYITTLSSYFRRRSRSTPSCGNRKCCGDHLSCTRRHLSWSPPTRGKLLCHRPDIFSSRIAYYWYSIWRGASFYAGKNIHVVMSSASNFNVTFLRRKRLSKVESRFVCKLKANLAVTHLSRWRAFGCYAMTIVVVYCLLVLYDI